MIAGFCRDLDTAAAVAVVAAAAAGAPSATCPPGQAEPSQPPSASETRLALCFAIKCSWENQQLSERSSFPITRGVSQGGEAGRKGGRVTVHEKEGGEE